MDGFGQHHPALKTDNSGVAGIGLLAAHGHAPEPPEPASSLYDTSLWFVKVRGAADVLYCRRSGDLAAQSGRRLPACRAHRQTTGRPVRAGRPLSWGWGGSGGLGRAARPGVAMHQAVVVVSLRQRRGGGLMELGALRAAGKGRGGGAATR